MHTQILLRTGTVPTDSCAIMVSLTPETASTIVDAINAFLSVQSSLPELNAFHITNHVPVSIIPQTIGESIISPPPCFSPIETIINVNLRMVVTGRGAHWEGANDRGTAFFRSATLPAQIIQYLALGGSFAGETEAQMYKATQQLAPPSRGLFISH